MDQEIKRRETYYYCWDTGVRNILLYIRECYPEYVSDTEIVGKKLRFSKWDCEYIKELTPEVMSEKSIAAEILRSPYLRGEYVPMCVLPNAGDRDFCLEAVKATPEAYKYISGAFQKDREFALALIAFCGP